MNFLQQFIDVSGFNRETFVEDLFLSWQQTLGSVKHSYASAADSFIDEFFVTVSQEQLNDLLYQYVTKNVDMVLDLKLELHDGWLRLIATVNFKGIFATVASNFELVQLQLDRHRQRLVLRQISDTDIIELHSRKFWQAPLARFAVKSYRTLLKKDPLPFILSSIPIKGVPFTEHKGDVIYLEIGRWLKKAKIVMKNIRKVQINTGVTMHEQLILKAQPNFGEILSFGDPNADIITEDDNPNKPVKPKKDKK
ncbi:hypothetical protein B0181_05495 [Moraxella caviae]|uniref:Uncharacterized protein n=1 Tax=Moraxella caviae TaxID=34060 RepID=A0A1T0A3J1_9GAMM|nr:hypothetical protein B0181_05495 [Moraxella caviae]